MEESPVLALVQLVLLIAMLFPMANILKRAGFNPWLVLLGIIPLVNIVMFLVFAFSKWPRLRSEPADLAETFQ